MRHIPVIILLETVVIVRPMLQARIKSAKSLLKSQRKRKMSNPKMKKNSADAAVIPYIALAVFMWVYPKQKSI